MECRVGGSDRTLSSTLRVRLIHCQYGSLAKTSAGARTVLPLSLPRSELKKIVAFLKNK